MKAGGGVGLPFLANKHQIYEASGDTTGAGAVKNRKVLQILRHKISDLGKVVKNKIDSLDKYKTQLIGKTVTEG